MRDNPRDQAHTSRQMPQAKARNASRRGHRELSAASGKLGKSGMAIRHGLAGQFSKGESKRRTKRTMDILLLVAAYALGGLGFLFGYSLSHWGPGIAIIGMLA